MTDSAKRHLSEPYLLVAFHVLFSTTIMVFWLWSGLSDVLHSPSPILGFLGSENHIKLLVCASI